MTTQTLMQHLLDFRNARDWAQFHTPENLAKSISIEAAELLEHYQWGDPSEPEEIDDEIADILIYAYLMADAIGKDPATIMLNKLAKNEHRFPVAAVKGNSGKHTRVDP